MRTPRYVTDQLDMVAKRQAAQQESILALAACLEIKTVNNLFKKETHMTYKTITSEQLNRVLSSTATNSFTENIARMHDIYRLPKNTVPTLDPELLGESPLRRLDKFRNTLEQELNEYNLQEAAGPLPLRDRLIAFQAMTLDTHTAEQIEDARQDMLTDLGDWFADIVVYCTSEAMKFGLPLTDIQDAVMGSNFTKLASDGIPRYDDNGKFQKDLTNFVPPEPAIKTLMFVDQE